MPTPRPVPPFNQAVDTGGQWVMAVGTTLVLLVAIVLVVRMARRLGAGWPIVVLVSAGSASFCEPLYDNLFNLWFYDGPKTWALYRAFGGNPQPWWVPVTYIWVYGAQALWVWSRIERGATRRDIGRMVAVLWTVFTGFELLGTNFGTYEYYGSHPFRVAGFPVWVSLSNVVLTVVVGIALSKLVPVLPGFRAGALVVLVPAVFCLVSFGGSILALDVISHQNPNTALMWGAAAVAQVFGLLVLYLASRALPEGRPATIELSERPKVLRTESLATSER